MSLWCFAILVNNYFQVFFNLKAILYVAKITQNINKTLNIKINGKFLIVTKKPCWVLKFSRTESFQTSLDANIDYYAGFDPYKNCLQVEPVSVNQVSHNNSKLWSRRKHQTLRSNITRVSIAIIKAHFFFRSWEW